MWEGVEAIEVIVNHCDRCATKTWIYMEQVVQEWYEWYTDTKALQ